MPRGKPRSKQQKRRLSQLEENFCREYSRTGKAAHSFRHAGYATAGDEDRHSAQKILQRPHVKARIDDIKRSQQRIVDVRDDAILRELAAVAFTGIADLVDEDGEPIPPQKLPRQAQAAIQEVSFIQRDGKTHYRYKLHDKLRATDLLARIKGLVKDSKGNVSITLDFKGKPEPKPVQPLAIDVTDAEVDE